MLIHTWKQFGRKARPQKNLLAHTNKYPNPVFISGCQRSGGTMLAKIITSHNAITDFSWSKDAELDAATLLCGLMNVPSIGRSCFQTTYLNEQYFEFTQITEPFKLVWLVRNPDSVVCSMLYNWKRFALNELFISCGQKLLDDKQRTKFDRWGIWSVKPIERACLSYVAKVRQIESLSKALPKDQLLVIEYESLVQSSTSTLKTICDFLELPWTPEFGSEINQKSLKKADRISDGERAIIKDMCGRAYTQAKELITK